MQKLSQHYRNDSAEGLDPAIRDYLDKNYFAQLSNIDKANPKLLVVFSGGNAVGKSTISNKISEKFGGLVLENDAVKRQLLKLIPTADRDLLSNITWQYTMDLYSRLNDITPNGLIVRDGVIDWYFDRILPVFKKAGYELFIIGFDISKQKSIELIKSRGDTPTVKEERFYKLMGDHEVHTKRFRAEYKTDVTLKDENLFDQDLILDALQQRLASLNK